MQRRIPIYIVCSPRPRTGKTLLARVLADFFRADERPVAAFDVNPDDFPLMEYLPGYTAVASVAHTRDQIALFDRLLEPDRVPKVVDVGHHQFDTFFTVVEQIAFADEARRRGLIPIAMFLGDGHRRAHQGYNRLLKRHPRLMLVAAVNEALPGAMRFRDELNGPWRADAILTVPALSPVVRGITERPSFSFAATAATSDRTSELYTWTRRLFVQFRELELRLMLDDLTPALKFSA